MITTALALHLWHIVAEGGKLTPSPVTSMSSCRDAASLTSLFFFERFSS
jgi:hypothetical protein